MSGASCTTDVTSRHGCLRDEHDGPDERGTQHTGPHHSNTLNTPSDFGGHASAMEG